MADTAVDCIKYLRDTAIAADTAIGSRIYMSIAPQSGSYPMAVMEIISREESATQAIGSAMDTYRVQVDVFAKNTTGTSGFDAANAVANALRVAWSRTGNTGDYTNIIDGIQEVDYRTDFLPDLQVYQISNDYMVRVSPNGEVSMANYSLSEQVWPYSKWINGETIYWRTWQLSDGIDDFMPLTGLTDSEVDVIIDVKFNAKEGSAGLWRFNHLSDAVELKLVTGSWTAYTKIDYEINNVTVWYTKN